MPFAIVFGFDGAGKVTTYDAYYDQYTLLSQLGHIPRARLGPRLLRDQSLACRRTARATEQVVSWATTTGSPPSVRARLTENLAPATHRERSMQTRRAISADLLVATNRSLDVQGE